MADQNSTPEELLADGWHMQRGYLKSTPTGSKMVQTWARSEERLEIAEEES